MIKFVRCATLIFIIIFTPRANAAETIVRQTGQSFDKSNIKIRVGDHVKFTNEDEVKHNIMIQSGDNDDDGRDLGLQRPGETLDMLFDKAGRFRVRCHIHPGMKLGVTVG